MLDEYLTQIKEDRVYIYRVVSTSGDRKIIELVVSYPCDYDPYEHMDAEEV